MTTTENATSGGAPSGASETDETTKTKRSGLQSEMILMVWKMMEWRRGGNGGQIGP